MPSDVLRLLRSLSLLAVALGSAGALPPTVAAQTSEPPAVPASLALTPLPLEEVLRLYRENTELQADGPAPPPVAAAVQSIEFQGQLLEEAVDLKASFRVVVLDDAWVSVPLLRKDPSLLVAEVPALEGAVLISEGEHLALTTRRPGVYQFEIALLARARAQGDRRTAILDIAGATLSRLRLQVDRGLFRLASSRAVVDGDAWLLFPEGNRLTVAWEHTGAAAAAAANQPLAGRPPIESVVPRARASVVSTLEGRTVFRLLYELRFEGSRPIAFELLPDQSLERVYVNGVATPFEVDGTSLALDVAPRRAGDQSGTVELVLVADQGGYFLSGDLLFAFPQVSWPVNELAVDVHLPEVFNYTWVGGSLSPAAAAGAIPELTYAIPEPGKELLFHQDLIVRSAPTLRVDYAIDLDGRYFVD